MLELIQMTLALSLFAIGVLLFGITQVARSGALIRLTPPLWMRWAGVTGLLIILGSALY